MLTAAGVVGGGFRLQLCSGSSQGVQPILTALRLLGQLIATLAFAVPRVLLGVDQLGLAQQRCDLGFQLGLDFEHPLLAQLLRRSQELRLVFGGIGLDLGAVESDVAQTHQARLLAQPQHLHK